MDGFREGFEFFAEHASDFAGMDLGSGYVDSVNGEISEFIESVAHFKGMQSSVDTLKGDLAEFWHAGTFNIDAAVKGSGNRVQVDRSHDFGSVDVSGKNIELDAGLKYYKNGVESAKQQAKSVFEAYKKYQSGGGKETLEEYLKNRNYQDDSVLNDAVYSGQIRVIPADQLTEATKWLERKIAEAAYIIAFGLFPCILVLSVPFISSYSLYPDYDRSSRITSCISFQSPTHPYQAKHLYSIKPISFIPITPLLRNVISIFSGSNLSGVNVLNWNPSGLNLSYSSCS